jgi:hypothetical protein
LLSVPFDVVIFVLGPEPQETINNSMTIIIKKLNFFIEFIYIIMLNISQIEYSSS